MHLYTIGTLAKKFNLSRSTLLYYDSIGLLKPTKREGANYRKYSEQDIRRLEQICTYRKAALPLKDIKKILDSPESENVELLEKHLDSLNDQIQTLRDQQYLIVQLLKDDQLLDRIRVIRKDTWVSLLYSVGFNEVTSERWHSEFEKLSPDEHRDFLKAMGIPENKIHEIRNSLEHHKFKEKEDENEDLDKP